MTQPLSATMKKKNFAQLIRMHVDGSCNSRWRTLDVQQTEGHGLQSFGRKKVVWRIFRRLLDAKGELCAVSKCPAGCGHRDVKNANRRTGIRSARRWTGRAATATTAACYERS